ncbi:hypothetical protein Tsubulata_021557 [Turnera subulata]|uniref:Gamma-tubulin complex component n=1 Tax=Turnera subulata TaxID=218843 RepID=A0A9Q0JPH7_9ROSI|nr:hypothetical protein Tsubulata_021557 [Turnera subulata]
MVEKKRKTRDEKKHKADKSSKKFKSKASKGGGDKRSSRKTGPRLPNALRKELDRFNPKNDDRLDSEGEEDEEIKSDDGNDLYEYEEGVAEEESRKNRRFDPVENYEYELPEDFKDENVESDDEDDDFGGGGEPPEDEAGEEDDGRHLRMLQGITGMPSDAFEEKKKKNVVIYESYPESEYNPTRDVVEGTSRITVQDLLESLQGNPAYSKLRKDAYKKKDKKSLPLQPPLPKEVRDRVERKVAYEQTKKHITNFEPFVKSYREAPTVIFDKDTDSGYSTVGAIASEFKPRTEFEKKMFSLVSDEKVMGAHKEDGAKLLELNKIPVEDYVNYQNHIAKMRSLLFRHEVKSKRIKKIKSKAYHRLLKKDKLKSAAAEIQMNKEAAKKLEVEQEFKRAEERLTLRHKNRNKWARRILERGVHVQDEGTRAALAEQLAKHNSLTRKMSSMDSSSDDDSESEEDDDDSAGSDQERALKVLEKATQKTLQVLKEDNELPETGVLSLPFMKRAMAKRDEAAAEDAKLALQEFESSLKHLEDTGGAESTKGGAVSGRRMFGPKKQDIAPKAISSNNHSSDTEEELEAQEDDNPVSGATDDIQNVFHNNDFGTHQNYTSGSIEIDKESAPKTTYEVAMLVSDKWEKVNTRKKADNSTKLPKIAEPANRNQVEESETDSEEQMVDGILSSGLNKSYELPSQAELVREAFAGDDVEDEFMKDKEELLNEENPEPEKPVLVPGWGQWTHIQKKKGLPSWMVEEHEIAKRKREAAIKSRKDANLKHVIISEKLDKKVVKKTGLIIKPIRLEDVDPYEKGEGRKRTGQKPKERIKKSQNKAKPMTREDTQESKRTEMLHELLLALLGYPGDLIIDEREHQISLGILPPDAPPVADDSSFKLAPDISFLDPSDRDLIERIITLGFYYRKLDHFATKSRNLSWIGHPLERANELAKNKPEKPSVYRRAIANGIVEILSVYRSAVLQIERKLLSETLPILATVTQGLNKFFVLLPPLHELVQEIEREDIRGGRLLNLLHKRCHCGVPELQTCIQRLLWHGHQVLYNQLASWMVYGILQDHHGEFFIRRQEERGVEHGPSHSNVSEKLASLSTDDVSLTDWHDMLPEYIHMRVAESILFAGKAIRVLRNPSSAFQLKDPVSSHQITRRTQKIQGFAGRFPLKKEPFTDTNLIGEELLPQSEADKIEAMLQHLKESSEFHKRSFECSVDSIRAIAASHLWQCFLEESRQLMRLPPRQSTAEADLMVPFQLAAIKTISEEDKYFPRVSLRMPSFGTTVKSSQLSKTTPFGDGNSAAPLSNTSSDASLDGWDGIALEYSVDWPLHLFFTPEVLSKYLRVFQYLLRLKRTQMELEKSWASVMHQDHTDFAKRRKDRVNSSVSQQRRQRFRPMWRVREHMAFLIRNLQFYIQVDVIESQWNVLQARIQESNDFTELVGFHQEYLSALISQSFLDIGSLSRILDSIMKLCLQFCWSLENQESNPNMSELEHLTEEFNKKSNSLYTILRSSRLAGSQRAPFLRRFLLRLNFNLFFEATARGVLNVVRPTPTFDGVLMGMTMVHVSSELDYFRHSTSSDSPWLVEVVSFFTPRSCCCIFGSSFS